MTMDFCLLHVIVSLMILPSISSHNGHQNHHVTNPSESILFGPEGKFTRCCPEDAIKELHNLKTIYRNIFFPSNDELHHCSRCRLYEAITKYIDKTVSEDVREASHLIVNEEFGKYFSDKLHGMKERFYRGEENLQDIVEVEAVLDKILANLKIPQNPWRTRIVEKFAAHPLTEKELEGHLNHVICESFSGKIPMLRNQGNNLELVYPSGKIIDTASAESMNSLVQFYAKTYKCLKTDKKDLEDFNEKLLRWISHRVLPVLHNSPKVLPAFGAIHRINSTIQDGTSKNSLVKFYSRISDEVSEIPNHTLEIVAVIVSVIISIFLFILALWYCIWRAKKSPKFQGKYNKLKSSQKDQKKNSKKSSKNSGNSSKSSGEEIELFSRNPGNSDSDSVESVELESATIIHTSPRRKIFREFSTPAFKLLNEEKPKKTPSPKESPSKADDPPKETIQ